MMFHYRWYYAADRAFAQTWIVNSRDAQMEEGARRGAMRAFNDRQVGRMALVGCTEQNRPVIEDSYRFVLDTLNRHVRRMPYLFGSRPSLADFGIYGQLQILSIDPTPAAEMRARAPNVFCWPMRLDDASGCDGAWADAATPLPRRSWRCCDMQDRPTCRSWLPTRALQHGESSFDVEILGRRFSQGPFRYQGKCYDALRKRHSALPSEARRRIERVLAVTGCHTFLA